MANKKHLEILNQGTEFWNKWRNENQYIIPDLKEADLSKTKLNGINFRKAELDQANFWNTSLIGANFIEASLWSTNFSQAYLFEADFTKAKIVSSRFSEANLSYARFLGADLRQADLRSSIMVHTDLRLANISQSLVFGISAWNVKLVDTLQNDLLITEYNEPIVRVDDLEVAQFIYLMLHNEKIRKVIHTIGKKAVLILGRFTQERKAVLDELRNELRKKGYLPILFDFKKPDNRDLSETISILAHLSRFIIADITQTRAVAQELQLIIPNLPSVPILPICHYSDTEYGMFEHFKSYPWVLPVYRYESEIELLNSFIEKIMIPVENKLKENRKD